MRSVTRLFFQILPLIPVLAAPALADELFVGGPSGAIMHGDPITGGFEFTAACGGPIRSMTINNRILMIGDSTGNVYGVDLDVENGGAGYYFTLPGSDNTGVITHDGAMLFSSFDGTIRRVSPILGDLLETYTSPIEIQAMTSDGEFMYVAGPEGNVYRASLEDGQFSYFACACLGSINSLAVLGEDVVAGDHSGFIMRFSRQTGTITGGFMLPGDNIAMTVSPENALFVADSDGSVRRVDALTGEIFSTFSVGVSLAAMVFVDTETDCPADFNADGDVNSADFFEFVTAFLQSTFISRAGVDQNADGVVDSRDFHHFLTNFFTPCN